MSTTNPTPALMYTPCRNCLNEGLFFCRICKANYCDEHACYHLGRIESAELPAPTYESVLFGDSSASDEQGFNEYSDEQLKQVPEMRLRSRLQRLMAEAKRVQRELERRMIHNAEMQGIKRKLPVMPQHMRDVYGVSNREIKNEKQAAKAAEKQQQQQAKIQAALRILLAEQLKNKKG